MIYELSLVTKAELSDDEVAKVKDMVLAVIKEHDGEVYIEDDWGTLNFAQPTSTGIEQGHYLYFLYKANNVNNVELARRFRINDGVMKHIVIKVKSDNNMLEPRKVNKKHLNGTKSSCSFVISSKIISSQLSLVTSLRLIAITQ